jgi:4-amino-4-deoxy-L-arabinose transferase-like glycosyltransferase
MRWLLLMLLVALSLRVAWMTFFTEAINSEGTEYARIAENLVAGRGYVGLAMEGVELMFPPLFPLMIAAGSYVVGSSYLAAQLIALSAGVVLLLLVFGIVRDLYNEKTALVAVGVASLHPVLIKLSGTSWVEGPYITLLMACVYFMNRVRRSPEYLSWSLVGAFAGLAYLTSPQALLFPFVFLISQLLMRQNRNLVTFRRVAVLVGSFVVLALPYVIFLSTSTGTLRLEGKTIVNNELGSRLLRGDGKPRRQRGLDEAER